MSYVIWLNEVKRQDANIVGVKAANLGELLSFGYSVPSGFIINPTAFFDFMEENKIKPKITGILKSVDYNDIFSIKEASKKISYLILNSPIDHKLLEEIKIAYAKLGMSQEIRDLKDSTLDTINVTYRDVLVSIRSSIVSENSKNCSFSGQSDFFLNIKNIMSLEESIKKCWASFFSPRCIYYRKKRNITNTSISLIVQRMIDSKKSGTILTTSLGDNNANYVLIEGVWGFGQVITSGEMNPDTFIFDKQTKKLVGKKINPKEWMLVRDELNDLTTKERVDEGDINSSVLNEREINFLLNLAEGIESHFGYPQLIEWSIQRDKVHVLQSTPLTISNKKIENSDEGDNSPILSGLGISPGITEGEVVVLTDNSSDIKDKIIVVDNPTPNLTLFMGCGGIIADNGGATCHIAMIAREFGVPLIVGSENATLVLKRGDDVKIDGISGSIFKLENRYLSMENINRFLGENKDLITATKIKLLLNSTNLNPEVKNKVDGIGILDPTFLLENIDLHSIKGKEYEFMKNIERYLSDVAKVFYPSIIWFKLLEKDVKDFHWRGIRKHINDSDLFKIQVKAIESLIKSGYDNIGLLLPFVNYPSEVEKVKEIIHSVGVDPNIVKLGILIETPGAALLAEEFSKAGVNYAIIDLEALTQYTLGVDKKDPKTMKYYNELHPALFRLIKSAAKDYKKHNIPLSIFGASTKVSEMTEKLVEYGVDSITTESQNIDLIKYTIARSERKILFNLLREHRLGSRELNSS